MGARERITDTELPHIAALPQVLPELFRTPRRVRAREAGFDGVELHYAHAYTHGLVPVGDQHARGRLRRHARASRALAARGIGGGARRDRRGFRRRRADPGGGMHRGRLDGVGCGILRRRAGGGRDATSFPSHAAASSTTRSSQKWAPRPIRTPDRAAMNACRATTRTRIGPYGRNLEPAARDPRRGACRRAIEHPGGRRRNSQFPAGGSRARARAPATSSASPARRSPILTGFSRFARAGGAEVRLCKYTNYCEALDQRHREVTCELWDRERSAAARVRRDRPTASGAWWRPDWVPVMTANARIVR